MHRTIGRVRALFSFEDERTSENLKRWLPPPLERKILGLKERTPHQTLPRSSPVRIGLSSIQQRGESTWSQHLLNKRLFRNKVEGQSSPHTSCFSWIEASRLRSRKIQTVCQSPTARDPTDDDSFTTRAATTIGGLAVLIEHSQGPHACVFLVLSTSKHGIAVTLTCQRLSTSPLHGHCCLCRAPPVLQQSRKVGSFPCARHPVKQYRNVGYAQRFAVSCLNLV